MPGGTANDVRALLASFETIKYGQSEPTRFAVDDALVEARRLVQVLGTGPPDGQGGGPPEVGR